MTESELQQLIGLTEAQARQRVEDRGLDFRVIREGEDVSSDANYRRVTVFVRGDRVEGASMY